MSFGHVSVCSNIELCCDGFMRTVTAKSGRRIATSVRCISAPLFLRARAAELPTELVRKVGTKLSFHPTFFTLYKYIIISGSNNMFFNSKNPKLQRETFERKSNQEHIFNTQNHSHMHQNII